MIAGEVVLEAVHARLIVLDVSDETFNDVGGFGAVATTFPLPLRAIVFVAAFDVTLIVPLFPPPVLGCDTTEIVFDDVAPALKDEGPV